MKTKRWIDPRLIIGAALVVVSIIGVAFVVTSANRTVEVWVVSEPVAAGEVLAADDVALARVQLEQRSELYHVQDDSPVGLVVTQSRAAGELIPRSGVVDEAIAASSRIVVPVDAKAAVDLGRGDVVDIWAAAPSEERTSGFVEPRILVDDAVVVAVHAPDGLLSAASVVQVELLIPDTETSRALDAISNKHAIHLVPDTVSEG
ncbi:MAG: SAF domain-containing protein [Agrococcus casei]|uniref:SAF domain-containing protein n=1 Tax=Agrococcus casei TaxID=343512 RepID=UPI003F979F0B